MKKETGSMEIKPTFYYQKWDHYHPVTGFINDGGANIYGLDLQTDFRHSFLGAKALFTSGLSGQMDNSDGKKYSYGDYQGSGGHSTGSVQYTLSDARGQLAEIDDDKTTKWGVYAQESLRPSDRWIVDLGVRYDKVDFDMNEQKFLDLNYGTNTYVSAPGPFQKDLSFDSVSPKLGVVYKLSNATTSTGTRHRGSRRRSPRR